MEFLKQLITRILGSGLLSTALVLVRAVTVLMVLYVIWRCYTSFIILTYKYSFKIFVKFSITYATSSSLSFVCSGNVISFT